MKTRFAMFAMLLCAALMFTACGPDFSSPEGAVKAFLEASEKKDEEAIKETLVKKEREEIGKEDSGMKIDTDNKPIVEGEYSLGTAKVEGDKAAVPVTAKNKDGKEETLHVVAVKEDGEWRVSMMETLAYMFTGTFSKPEGGGE